MMVSIWEILIFMAMALFVVALLHWLLPSSMQPSPESGERGRRRKEALDRGGFFRRIEPLMRLISTRISTLPLGGLRGHLEERIEQSGRPWGLNGDDLSAFSMLTGVAAGLAGGVMFSHLGRGPAAGAIIGVVFGASVPWFKLDEICKKRRVAICRGLPQAVDLIALSMEAGLDFSGALSQVIGQMKTDNPLRFEFEHILRRLSLGWSRQAALKEFAVRTPIVQVRQFASSVIQAEKRGTPLAQVLSTQAEVMRTKRSQAAEQAAARAAVLILGPLMLIFACVFLILLGPFAIKFIRGEMF
jgi:tight adherence protein C